MKRFVFLILFAPSMVFCQNGIIFRQELSWRQVLDLAKAEDKDIFVDGYASWCAPCKYMDSLIYNDGLVGEYMNKHFVSVKVQLDTTRTDDPDTRRWYPDARMFAADYDIRTLPSYLFFSPGGPIIHRDLGVKNREGFLRMAGDAMDPKAQFYSCLERYFNGGRNYPEMPALYAMCNQLGKKEWAYAIGRDYVDNYLLKLCDSALYTRENCQFMGIEMSSSHEPAFFLFYHHPEKIDKLFDFTNHFSRSVIEGVIAKEEIDPVMNTRSETAYTPDWQRLQRIVQLKYNSDYAFETIIDAQLRWYEAKADWEQVAALNIKKIAKLGLDTAGNGKYILNNMIWQAIFLHSKDRAAISKGIDWMEIVMKAGDYDAIDIDTYANLLYKAGRTKEAVIWEQKANEKAIETKDIRTANETSVALAKMKAGQPTWPTSVN